MRLNDKIALITGASAGIGRASALRFAAEGAKLVLNARRPEPLHALAQQIRAAGGQVVVHAADVADPATAPALVELARQSFGGLDIALNNAGMLVEGERFGAIDAKALADSFATNAQGPFLLAQALAPRLAEGARVANLTSTLGSIGSTDSLYSPSYSISKAALNMASRLLALALEPRRAIVIALCPGWVRTDMGGANAPLGAPESVAAMLRVIDALKPGDSGSFLSERGHPIPW